MRIVRIANFVTPTSGGLRTVLVQLGEGYRALGHETILVVPGEIAGVERTDHGEVVTVPGTRVPWLGGYRVILRRRPLRRLLERLRPDRLEVSDRSTLAWLGPWARRAGVPAVLVSHESLYGLLGMAPLPVTVRRRLADVLNVRAAAGFDRVVCTTLWAATEFATAGVTNIVHVPLGVDLETFHPDRYRTDVRERYAPAGRPLLVACTRLSVEKRPDRLLTTLASVRAKGVDARLVVIGDGPSRSALERDGAGLPVSFTGWLTDRVRVAELMASADVMLAQGPIETFGLAALEAMACGTPAAVSATGALAGVVGTAGAPVAGDDLAPGVLELLRRPERDRREAARRQAEQFSWSATVAGFLAAHGVEAGARTGTRH